MLLPYKVILLFFLSWMAHQSCFRGSNVRLRLKPHSTDSKYYLNNLYKYSFSRFCQLNPPALWPSWNYVICKLLPGILRQVGENICIFVIQIVCLIISNFRWESKMRFHHFFSSDQFQTNYFFNSLLFKWNCSQ